MHVRVGTNINHNDGLDSVASLSLNRTTYVRVEAVGSNVALYLNNKLDSSIILSGVRVSGQATLYVPDPWYSPALASIASIQMKPISALKPSISAIKPSISAIKPSISAIKPSISAIKPSDFNGPLKVVAYEESVDVPENYSL